jgi:general secretion pathway protein K
MMGGVKHSKQSGFALIIVLMILAMMVTVAASMTGRLTLNLKRTEGLIFSQKVYWYGQAAAELGRMVLNEDFANSSVTSLDQIWATPDMVFPLDGGHIAGKVKDLRSCFNVNAVNSSTAISQFQALLEAVGLGEYNAEMIAQSTFEWIDEDSRSDLSQGAEDSFYQARKVPHLAANNLLVEISELRAVQGVDRKSYETIVPYLCAPPSSEQRINVNTVSVEQAEILYALFESTSNLGIGDFESILEERPASGWDSVDNFLESSLLAAIEVDARVKKQLAVSSEFFQFEGAAQFEDRTAAFKFLFQVAGKKASVIRYQSGGFK